MASTINQYKILTKHKNGELTYGIEYPLIVGNNNVYYLYLEADSIAEWFKNSSLSTLVFTFYNTKTQVKSEEIYNGPATIPGDTSGLLYYYCRVPQSVLSNTGKLQFSITATNTNKQTYKTIELSYPPDIYPAPSSGNNISFTEYSSLLTLITNLQGGNKGEVLIKRADNDPASMEDDYNFSWGTDFVADEALKLHNPRTISLSGMAEGSTTYDGSANSNLKVTKLNFGEGTAITGKIPVSALPDSIMGQMVFGGTIDASSGTITLSSGAKARLGLTVDTITAANLDKSKAEGMYFIGSKSGSNPLTMEIGDWLVINNSNWSRVDNTDAIRTVRGANESAGRTGDIVLDANQIGAAKANIGEGADATKGYPAYRADQLTTVRTINGASFNGSANITNYCVCPTAAATAAKTASLTGFSLQSGSTVYVKFENTNAAANVTLNINGTGAKPVYARGSQVGSTNLGVDTLKANYIYLMVYDGSNYIIATGIDSAPTQISSQRSVATLKAGASSVAIPSDILGAGDVTGNLQVYIDGVLKPTTSYSISSGNITNLATAAYDRTVDFVLYLTETIAVPTQLSQLEDTTTTTPIKYATNATQLKNTSAIGIASSDGSNVGATTNFNGTQNITLKLPSTIKASLTGNVTGNVTGDVTGNVSGNAGSATKLQTARKIGNASFNGTADISLASMGATSIAYQKVLTTGSWSSNTQSISGLTAVTTTNNIVIAPIFDSATNWILYGIRCTAQANGSLTFTCNTTPTVDITIQILVLP